MGHEFYISGESYGGIYVPTLAYAIHMYNLQPHNGTQNQTINLKGFIFGNGCVTKDECVNEV